jgi:hypothetical protein
MPGLDLNEPINWDDIGDFEGHVHELNYDYVWDDGNKGNHRYFLSFLYSFIVRAVYLNGNDTADGEDNDDEDEDGQGEGDGNTADGEDEAVHGEPEAGNGAHTVEQVEEADYVPQADADDSGTPLHALIIFLMSRSFVHANLSMPMSLCRHSCQYQEEAVLPS